MDNEKYKTIIIESRPDTDAIESYEKRFYEDPENWRFRECETCASKPGTPDLCRSCYHNRTVIGILRERLRMNE